MGTRNDYRCVECGAIIEAESSHDRIIIVHDSGLVPGQKCGARHLDRVWGPMHTGRGSSGEPPR